jgi:polysaccharide biosynthesis transport protein
MKTNESIDVAATLPSAVSGAIEPAMYVRSVDVPHIALPTAPPLAEQRYRLAAVRLEAALDQRRPLHDTRALGRLVLVTSPEPGDGKTTTALHLAVALSQGLGRRVALVELDGSRPGLASALGLPPGRGLADVLGGEARLDDVILRAGDGGPLIIPGGEPGGLRASGSALLAPLHALREVHDYVIVDCAALSTSADAAVLGRAADGILLIVRAGATRGPALSSALEALVDAPLLGCVLNDHDGDAGRPPAATRRPVRSLTSIDEDD